MNLYSIYDKKAEYYLMPFFAESEAQAKRIVINSALSDTDCSLNRFSQDFRLDKLATLNINTGKVSENISTVAEVQSLVIAYQSTSGDDICEEV